MSAFKTLSQWRIFSQNFGQNYVIRNFELKNVNWDVNYLLDLFIRNYSHFLMK
jgi:hypothetical protein